MPPIDDDYGWFSPADFALVVHALSKKPAGHELIVIGGQSLVAWVLYYDITIPPVETPYLTQDLDILGLKADATWLAGQIDANLYVATLDDATPNSAQLVFKGQDGKRLIIDFLSGVLGVDASEAKKLAVPVVVADLPPFKVLHPLLCLQSRLENLFLLSEKRVPNGFAQAKVAVEVIRRFLREQFHTEGCRTGGRAAARIARISTSKAGLFCFHEYGIDPMTAVDPSEFACGLWNEREWPRLCAWVARVRERDKARRARYPTIYNEP